MRRRAGGQLYALTPVRFRLRTQLVRVVACSERRGVDGAARRRLWTAGGTRGRFECRNGGRSRYIERGGEREGGELEAAARGRSLRAGPAWS